MMQMKNVLLASVLFCSATSASGANFEWGTDIKISPIFNNVTPANIIGHICDTAILQKIATDLMVSSSAINDAETYKRFTDVIDKDHLRLLYIGIDSSIDRLLEEYSPKQTASICRERTTNLYWNLKTDNLPTLQEYRELHKTN